ncbi:unnamed protein product [Lactuca virosa]|uniref:Uncharacterized protein n=1 Tax=Lactuca virosa TaxID=75947 RepID=A0AAU9MT51_9ASTR|nr:unnamed protein product [Lactuca virosa]
MSNTRSQALGSANESGYVTARPKFNRDSSTEPVEDSSMGSDTGDEERYSMEAMARDLHDARNRIAYHHHNIIDMSEVVDAMCGYAYTVRRMAIRAMITSAIVGGIALILTVTLVWVIVIWG